MYMVLWFLQSFVQGLLTAPLTLFAVLWTYGSGWLSQLLSG